MIYFPATVKCSYIGCAKTAKVRLVFLGESGNYDAWEIQKKPKGWHITGTRFPSSSECCPKHNPELNSSKPNTKITGSLRLSKQKPSRHNNNGAYESKLPPLTTGGVRISDDRSYG